MRISRIDLEGGSRLDIDEGGLVVLSDAGGLVININDPDDHSGPNLHDLIKALLVANDALEYSTPPAIANMIDDAVSEALEEAK